MLTELYYYTAMTGLLLFSKLLDEILLLSFSEFHVAAMAHAIPTRLSSLGSALIFQFQECFPSKLC